MLSVERSTRMFSTRSAQLSRAVGQSSATKNKHCVCPVQACEPGAGVTLEGWSAQGLPKQHSVSGRDEVFKLILAVPTYARL